MKLLVSESFLLLNAKNIEFVDILIPLVIVYLLSDPEKLIVQYILLFVKIYTQTEPQNLVDSFIY